jgi:ABC-type branched-subunit amino acid transport system ATPase component/ABC-type branched-subunit amino acid transport system permease subunit
MGLDAVVLGLFTGLTYGLLAVGLVLVYRSSRFVNFAHGSIGVFGAAVLGRLVSTDGLPYWLAFPIAMLVAGGVGAAVEAGLVRRLRDRPRVIGMIVTLGLSQFILVLALLVNSKGLSGLTFPKPTGLPSFTIGRTPVGPAFVAMLLLTPVLLAALALFLRRSRHGLAIRAAADAPEAAMLNGVVATRMATVAWAIAGAVAAFSAILVTPTQGAQSIETLGPELLLRGLAGAVIARLASIPIAFGASLAIGVLEQVLLAAGAGNGFVSVALGLIILGTLLAQPRLGRREIEVSTWPRAAFRASGGLRRHLLPGAGLLAAAALAYLVSNETASALTTIVGFALVGLSVLLVTGVAGELSLGQFAFAGIGAAVSVRVAADTGNFLVGVLAGCMAAGAAAMLVGVPALRLRGMALAVTTLAFALATSGWLLRQDWLLGDGAAVPKPQWTGYPLELAKDYYLFAVLMLAVGLWLTANLRGSGFGRVLLAMRDNEDAARALTVAAPLRKLQGYAVAGALAGLGGVVIGHGQSQLTVNSFPAGASIDVVAIAVVGGLALLSGPVLGAILIAGLPALFELGIIGQALLTVGWLTVVVVLPDGLASLRLPPRLVRLIRPVRLVQRRTPLCRRAADPSAVPKPRPAEAAHAVRLPGRTIAVAATAPGDQLLVVRGLARSFGGVRACDGVDLVVAPGEVVGIIGPNGAGKTTLFEIIAGFTAPDAGTIRFGATDVTRASPQRRVRLGLARSFQDARLFPTMAVRDAVMVAGERVHPSGLLAAALGAPQSDRLKARRADELIDLMGLSGQAGTAVGELSTGTRRIVELTCLLALEPTLLLLDEPSSGVSQADGEALGELLRRVNRELGTALLIIEHDLPLLSRLADRMIAMDAGRVLAEGTPDQVRTHPDVVRSYLGTDVAAVHRSGTTPTTVNGESYVDIK